MIGIDDTEVPDEEREWQYVLLPEGLLLKSGCAILVFDRDQIMSTSKATRGAYFEKGSDMSNARGVAS